MSTRPDLALLQELVPTWTREQIAALDEWRQGDLLPCPPLAWSTTAESTDAITGVTTPIGGIVPWPNELPKYAIITTQTCDIGGQGPGARHPFIQVSPVVNVADSTKEQWREMITGQLADRVGLTGKALRTKWAVDLRISCPLSKAALLNEVPTRGFATPAEAVEFGEHLARRAGRPALHDFLLDVVRPEINTAIDASRKKETGWWSKVDEVRLLIKGDVLEPKEVSIWVLTSSVLGPDEHDRWTQLGATFIKRAKAHGIKLRTSVQPIDETPARLYRDSIELYLSSLNR